MFKTVKFNRMKSENAAKHFCIFELVDILIGIFSNGTFIGMKLRDETSCLLLTINISSSERCALPFMFADKHRAFYRSPSEPRTLLQPANV